MFSRSWILSLISKQSFLDFDDGLEGFRTYNDNDAEWNSAKEETFMEKDEDIADHELNIDFE